MKVSGKILPGSVRVSVMAEGQRPRKTKRKREKATPVNAEIQAAVEKERHAQSIARAKREILRTLRNAINGTGLQPLPLHQTAENLQNITAIRQDCALSA